MEEQSLYILLFLFFLAAFSYFIAYKRKLIVFFKTDLHPHGFTYPLMAGLLTLLAIISYLFPIPYVSCWATALILLCFYILKERATFWSILKNQTTLPTTTLFKDILIGATVFIVALPFLSFFENFLEWVLFNYFHLEVPSQNFVEYIKQLQNNIPQLILMFLIVCVAVPIYEEFLYRANLQNWLKNYFSPFWAIFATSLLFSFSHFFTVDTFQGKAIIISSIFIASMYLGFAYERQRSLAASITYHFLVNTLTFIQTISS